MGGPTGILRSRQHSSPSHCVRGRPLHNKAVLLEVGLLLLLLVVVVVVILVA
jgi:hypothetical protein